MRIAQIIASADPGWGGPSGVLRGLCGALVERGHEVTVFSTDAAPGGQRTASGAAFGFDGRVRHQRARVDLSGPPYPSVSLAVALARALGGFDVAHVHGLFSVPTTTAMLACGWRGIPYVMRPCGMLDPWSLAHGGSGKALYWRAVDGPLVRRAAAVHVSTRHEAEGVRAALARLGGGARSAVAVEVCPQGVTPCLEGRERVQVAGRPYVLFLGRVAEKKGLIGLVRAFARLGEEDLLLRVVGPDERGHAAAVRAEAEALGIGSRVRIEGPVYDLGEKGRLYRQARAFCLPSADENFGVALVEAAGFGVPLVVTEGVGLADAVRDFAAGVVVDAEPAALAAGLRVALGEGRGGFSEGARRLAEDYTWEGRIGCIERLYVDAVSDRVRRD
jgi:glycosyltransferase involved in cell wall biosynthesis